ncbi:MAG: hypothetical protein AB7J35_11105 [Dehalococcoidia bacterium]
MAGLAVVELPYMTLAMVASLPEPVHVFPKTDGWIVVRGNKTDAARHFPDLGRALDAATGGENPVHVVVHESGIEASGEAGPFEKSS